MKMNEATHSRYGQTLSRFGDRQADILLGPARRLTGNQRVNAWVAPKTSSANTFHPISEELGRSLPFWESQSWG